MADGRVVIETDLDDSGAKKGLSKLGGTLGNMGKSIAGLGATALKGTAVAIAGVSTAIVGLGASAIKYNAGMEQYQTSFEVMTGSAEEATSVMDRLKKIGAETPFEFTDLANATQKLMAFGFTADEAIEQFGVLGDISQGDAQKLDSFAGALGKMQSSGKVSLEALNIMIEQGFNPLQVISDKTGESMESLYDRVSKGSVSLDEIKGAMVDATSEGGQFFQSMEKQSKTLNGRLSTLKDNFDSFTGSLFSGATSGAGNLIDVASSWIEELSDGFRIGGAEGLSRSFGYVLGEAVSMIAENLPDLLTLADTIISSLITSLTSTMYKQTDNIGTIITTLVTVLLSTMNNLFFFGVTMVDNILMGISQNIPNIISTISTNLDMMLETMFVFLPSMLQTGIEIVVQLALGLAQALPELIPKAIDLILLLVDTLLDNIDLIIDAGIQLIIGLALGLINALPKLMEKAPEIIKKLADAITRNAPKLADAATTIILTLAKGLLSNMPKLIGEVPGMVLSIVNAFIALRDSFTSIGENIISGIGEGLQNGWSWLMDMVGSLASGLFETAKKALDIHSPSKKFAWIGEMSADGMVKGFDDADPLNKIEKTMLGGVNSLQMGINSYVNGNTGNSYTGLADSIVGAISNSNLTVKIGNKEMGRIVRSYA